MYMDEQDCPDSVIERLKPIFPYLDILYLHCGGEPLIYKRFNEVLDLVTPPSKIRFNTNGVLLTKKRIKTIVDSGVVDVINFSVDAATRGTYEKLRGPEFDRVIANIKSLTKYKKKKSIKIPLIVINLCIMKENYKELPMFIELAKEVGAEGVDFFHLNKGYDWKLKRKLKQNIGMKIFFFNYKDQEKMNPNIHDKKVIEAYEKIKKLMIGMNFVGSVFMSEQNKLKKIIVGKKIKEIERNKKCLAPWSRAVVGVDGNVRMCYFHKESQESIGDLTKDSFKKIWNSERALKVRKEFLEKGYAKYCEKENKCMFLGRV